MKINELILLNDEQIDYSSLSSDTLKELALGDELFVATSALGELSSRNSSLAATVARAILSSLQGDRYLLCSGTGDTFSERLQSLLWST